MAERNSNMLLSNGAAPANGVGYGSVVQWFGGPLTVAASGAFDGATVDIVFCTRLPPLTGDDTYEDVLDEADWVSLQELTGPGVYSTELNPCLLATKITNSGADTRVRVIVS